MSYSWAVNAIKLQQATKDVENAKKLDPRVEITEEAVKEAYLKRAGLLREDAPVVVHEDKARGKFRVERKTKKASKE